MRLHIQEWGSHWFSVSVLMNMGTGNVCIFSCKGLGRKRFFTEKHGQRKERILREGFLGEGCLLATLHKGYGEDYHTAKCDSACRIEGLS